MRMHRFFVKSELAQFAHSTTAVFQDTAIIHQLMHVLRAKQNDPIELFDITGAAIVGAINDLDKKECSILIHEYHPPVPNTATTTLYMALLKRENFEIVVQKAAEIGITAIVPIQTARTIKTGFNKERIEKIAIEASEQSGRRHVPTIHKPMSFADAIRMKHGTKLFLDFDGTPFAKINQKDMTDSALFVGPEGGWTQDERNDAEKNGCIIAMISARTLRAETAAIVGSYLISGDSAQQ